MKEEPLTPSLDSPHREEVLGFISVDLEKVNLAKNILKKEMSKIQKLAQEIAYFITKPSDGIEIGGVSSQLIDIIRTQTIDNDRLRERVYDWIEFYVDDDETVISDYKSDYDKLFYN